MITVGLPKLALTDLRAPTLVAEFDLSCPAELIADPAARAGGLSVVVVEAAKVASPPRQALVLVRLHGEPIGSVCVALDQNGTSVATVREAVTDELAGLVARQFGADLLTEGGWDALTPPTEFAHAHAAHVAAPERVAVVLCTRERPLEVARCLASLAAQDHPDFSVWIIDNAPASNATRAVVEEYSDRLDLHYVLAPRPGLARARNVALAADLDAEVVAWIDDDEVADSQWLTELSRSLQGRPDADAVSGLVLPAELLTAAEIWFEQFGGHSKGRGYLPAEFSPDTWHVQDPLFPLPAFGVGANMAFRVATLRRIGGFDEALGAGTLTMGAEDTKAFTDLLLAKGTVLYRPSAVCRHYHRRDIDGLERQMRGYGTGLTAFYTAMLVSRPSTAWSVLRLVGRGLGELTSRDGMREATIGADFPRSLLAANRRSMLRGPDRYLRQRLFDAFLSRSQRSRS